MSGNLSRMPEYNGVTSPTWCPALPNALAKAATMSARPPLLENGCTSLLARRSRIIRSQPRRATPLVPLLRAEAFGFEIRLKRGRDLNAAVGLLPCLNERHEEARQSRAAAIKEVWKPVVAVFSLETQVHATRLEIFTV